MSNLLPGIYRHFKGHMYSVIGTAYNATTDSSQEFVVYIDCEDASKIWIRTVEDFLSDVDIQKYPAAGQRKRFMRI